MTADARCAMCDGFVAWFDDKGWQHRKPPSEKHDATPTLETLERTFVDITGLPAPGDPERRREWAAAVEQDAREDDFESRYIGTEREVPNVDGAA